MCMAFEEHYGLPPSLSMAGGPQSQSDDITIQHPVRIFKIISLQTVITDEQMDNKEHIS